MKQPKKNALTLAIEQTIFASKKKRVEALTVEAGKKYREARNKEQYEKRQAFNTLRSKKRLVTDKSKAEKAKQCLAHYKRNTADAEDFGLLTLKTLWHQLHSRLNKHDLKKISFRSFKIKMGNMPKSSIGGNCPNLYIEAAAWLVFPECWPDYSKNPPLPAPRLNPILKSLHFPKMASNIFEDRI